MSHSPALAFVSHKEWQKLLSPAKPSKEGWHLLLLYGTSRPAYPLSQVFMEIPVCFLGLFIG